MLALVAFLCWGIKMASVLLSPNMSMCVGVMFSSVCGDVYVRQRIVLFLCSQEWGVDGMC